MTAHAFLVDGPVDGAPALDRRRKAAMVVQLLLSDGRKIGLSRLPEGTQADLARELATLQLVDRDTLYAVAEEFANALDSIGLTAPGGVEETLAALNGQISADVQARLRREAHLARGLDPWDQIRDLTPARLAPMMQAESLEVAAVAMSKLPVAKAAEVLGLLPGDRARRIAYAVSQTVEVTPEAVARIGRALAQEYALLQSPVFAAPPVQRVGAILNLSQPETRDRVLAELQETDAAFADQLRRAIFTFADISTRIARLDLPRAIRGVENAVMVTALTAARAQGGAEAEVAEFILANMSQRLAESLREEIGQRGRVRRADGEKAMAELVLAIRDRVDSGEIKFIEEEEEE